MAMCYKKLWKLLIDRDMTRADLRKKTGISPATVAKMSKGEAIGANVLERICATMQCDVGDVMTYVPDLANTSKGKKVVSR
jgi:DNA-binding Xre family transcriptional regulator